MDFYHLRWTELLEKSVRAIELACHVSGSRSEVWPRYLAAAASWIMGDPDGMKLHSTAMLDLAEKLRDRGFLANALIMNAGAAHMKGDWQTARAFSDRMLAVAPNWFWTSTSRALLECEVGNFDEGELYLERLLEEMRRTPPGPTAEFAYAVLLPPLVASVTGVAKRFDVAEKTGQSVLASPFVTPRIAWDVNLGLALIAIHRRDTEAADKQYQLLAPTRGTALFHTPIDRILGLLARTTGKLDNSAMRFDQALTFCRRASYRPQYAWTCHDYAETLLLRDNSDDRQLAGSLLDEALSISGELSMGPLKERVASLIVGMTPRRRAIQAYPDGLTAREVEVLRLVATGMSNPEIAEELVISLNTVKRHLTNIFGKTGAASRAETGVYAARHELLPP